MKRYAKTALWITFGLLFVLIIVKVLPATKFKTGCLSAQLVTPL